MRRSQLLPCIGMLLLLARSLATQAPPQKPAYPQLPSETPETLVPSTATFDFERREVMIPMRDGVKLRTVIIVPKGATRAPILLTHTPYDARTQTGHAESGHMARILDGYDNPTEVIVGGGYIRAVQDIRRRSDRRAITC